MIRIRNLLAIQLLLVALLVSANVSLAGPCCGGGSSGASALIFGDNLGQVSLGIGTSSVVGDVGAGGRRESRSAGMQEHLLNVTLQGAHRGYFVPDLIGGDRWQATLEGVFSRKSVSDSHQWGVGDVSWSLGFDLIPGWTYSTWLPQLVVYGGLTVPTGRSIYESETFDASDVLGKGFWAPFLGLVATKTVTSNVGSWDGSLSLKVGAPLTQEFESEFIGRTEVSPGPQASGSLSLGFSPFSAVRLGLNWGVRHEASIRVQQEATEHVSSAKWGETIGATGSWVFTEGWLLRAGAEFPGVFGIASNSVLERSVSLSIQKNWSL